MITSKLAVETLGEYSIFVKKYKFYSVGHTINILTYELLWTQLFKNLDT